MKKKRLREKNIYMFSVCLRGGLERPGRQNYVLTFALNICEISTFLLAVTVIVVIAGCPLSRFKTPPRNAYHFSVSTTSFVNFKCITVFRKTIFTTQRYFGAHSPEFGRTSMFFSILVKHFARGG